MKMDLPQRSAVPPSIPPIDHERAKARHRDGMSCVTTSTYVYDANGYQRWCSDCGTELGEQSWVEGGADVPKWWLVAGAAMLALVLALVVVLVALPYPGANQGGSGGTRPGYVRPEPSPWPSERNVDPPAGSLPRPTPLPAPVVP